MRKRILIQPTFHDSVQAAQLSGRRVFWDRAEFNCKVHHCESQPIVSNWNVESHQRRSFAVAIILSELPLSTKFSYRVGHCPKRISNIFNFTILFQWWTSCRTWGCVLMLRKSGCYFYTSTHSDYANLYDVDEPAAVCFLGSSCVVLHMAGRPAALWFFRRSRNFSDHMPTRVFMGPTCVRWAAVRLIVWMRVKWSCELEHDVD